MRAINTNSFAPIQLDEMDKVKLMNRIDTKYWFHLGELQDILKNISDGYFLLNLNDECLLPYETVYYDTPCDKMFMAHHNGKLNRYKIRRRSYVSSGISFFEVKYKNNKGRTLKRRISSDFKLNDFSKQDKEFIEDCTPFSVQDLKGSLINNFSRLTLVSKEFNERCTIDLDLRFRTESKSIELNNLVIVEVKSDGRSSSSLLQKTLRDQRIKTSGFSKYCIGRTVTSNKIKRNAFKEKIRQIEKTIQIDYNLFN